MSQEKIKLIVLNKELAGKLAVKVLSIIKKAEDDFMLSYDLQAWNKASVDIVIMIDGLLKTDRENRK